MELVAAPSAAAAAVAALASAQPSTSAALALSSNSRRWNLRPHFLGAKLRISTSLQSPPVLRRHRSLQVSASKKTFTSFEDLLQNSELPVLVDFYATWCGPCQYMVPILSEVQVAMKEEINVVKIDSEKYSELASKYSIEALPTFILFKNGAPVDRFEGALPANKLIDRIRQVLTTSKAGV